MSDYELKIVHTIYQHFLETGSKEFTFCITNGSDSVHMSNAMNALEEKGFITILEESFFHTNLLAEDSLFRYMAELES